MEKQKARCLYMTDHDWQHLGTLAEASGCSRSSYVRRLIYLKRPKPVPSPDYQALYRELSAIGNNINQIARKVNCGEDFDSSSYYKDLQVVYDVQKRLRQMAILPEEMY